MRGRDHGRVSRAYRGLLVAMAAAGALILGATTLLVVADVVLRNTGFQPFAHTIALSEYGLLYATLFAAPWLARTGGHVQVEMLAAVLGPRWRRAMAVWALSLVLIAALIVVGFGLWLTWSQFRQGSFDMRSFDMPKWLLIAPLPLSFALVAVEYVGLLRRRDAGGAGGREAP
jgi:TRAP-type C4-dicarboxylate transport system permease small subunit